MLRVNEEAEELLVLRLTRAKGTLVLKSMTGEILQFWLILFENKRIPKGEIEEKNQK